MSIYEEHNKDGICVCGPCAFIRKNGWEPKPMNDFDLTTLFPARERHTCHAKGCTRNVPPKMFMCPKHWWMLPQSWRDGIWYLYTNGQENTKTPTKAYLKFANKCIRYIAHKEGNL